MSTNNNSPSENIYTNLRKENNLTYDETYINSITNKQKNVEQSRWHSQTHIYERGQWER